MQRTKSIQYNETAKQFAAKMKLIISIRDCELKISLPKVSQRLLISKHFDELTTAFF